VFVQKSLGLRDNFVLKDVFGVVCVDLYLCVEFRFYFLQKGLKIYLFYINLIDFKNCFGNIFFLHRFIIYKMEDITIFDKIVSG